MIALNAAAKEAEWTRVVYSELCNGAFDHNKADPIIVFEDNTGAKALAESFMINKRSRHFRVRLYYVRQQIRDGVLEVIYVNTKANIADTFTKPLTPALFLPFRDMLVQKPMTKYATSALLCRPSAFSSTRFRSTR